MRRKSSVETEPESSDTETNNNNPMQNEEQSSEQESELEVIESTVQCDEQEREAEISESDNDETILLETEMDLADDIELVDNHEVPPHKKSKLEFQQNLCQRLNNVRSRTLIRFN